MSRGTAPQTGERLRFTQGGHRASARLEEAHKGDRKGGKRAYKAFLDEQRERTEPQGRFAMCGANRCRSHRHACKQPNPDSSTRPRHRTRVSGRGVSGACGSCSEAVHGSLQLGAARRG